MVQTAVLSVMSPSSTCCSLQANSSASTPAGEEDYSGTCAAACSGSELQAGFSFLCCDLPELSKARDALHCPSDWALKSFTFFPPACALQNMQEPWYHDHPAQHSSAHLSVRWRSPVSNGCNIYLANMARGNRAAIAIFV